MIFPDIPQTGELPLKEWRKHLDAFIKVKQLNPDIIPYLSDEQRLVVNELKKAFIRIKAKQNARETTEDTE